jgi:hypothetical protein
MLSLCKINEEVRSESSRQLALDHLLGRLRNDLPRAFV